MENPYPFDVLRDPSVQMRLLTLSPASTASSGIYCSLETVAFLSQDLVYDALSYAWVAEMSSEHIHIGIHMMRVTKNLYGVLCRLREHDEPRVLWIDAICINQSDNEEKIIQVRRMRDIYFHASRVLAWLGESDEDIDEAMDFLQRLDTNIQTQIPETGFEKLFNSPWMTRMWVVQEVKGRYLFCAAKRPHPGELLLLCLHLFA